MDGNEIYKKYKKVIKDKIQKIFISCVGFGEQSK